MSKLKQHPESSRHAENRRGTRSHREYMSQYPFVRSVVRLASRKQHNAAYRAYMRGTSMSRVQGRIVRACLRDFYESQGSRCCDTFMDWGDEPQYEEDWS